MEFSANFTAIDFETASHRRDSACQLAAVVVRDGQIVDTAMWMIRPEPLYFTPANIRIHGITPDRVRDEPSFGESWPEIAGKIADDCLVAHNAGFDIGVLLACLHHRQGIPDLQFTCTRAIARQTWPGRRRYGLKPLSDWLGVRFRHHDALEDSIACAKILLAAGIDRQADSLPSLEKKLRLSRGSAGDWGHRGPSSSGGRTRGPNPHRVVRPPIKRQPPLPSFSDQIVAERRSSYDRSVSKSATDGTDECRDDLDFQRLMIRAEFIRSLSGQRVVFTGRLSTLSRDEAEQLATRLGASCQNSVDDETDLLVVGAEDQYAVPPGQTAGTPGRTAGTPGRTAGVKQESACQRQAAGQNIRICDEQEFLGLIISPVA